MALFSYLLNGILCAAIVFQLIKTKNSDIRTLRNTTLMLFASLAWYQLGWSLNILLTGQGISVFSFVWSIVNLPFSLCLINLIFYLRNQK